MPTSARPYQAGTAKFIQRKLCRELSVKLRRYTVVTTKNLYDPQLNCFYDPITNKYYELVQ